MNKKVVIIGGVAGGATCAARLRRLDKDVRIIILERGPYISYANCGLPYYIGGVIEDRDELLLVTPELFKSRFNIDVRINTEVTDIDPVGKTITVKNQVSKCDYAPLEGTEVTGVVEQVYLRGKLVAENGRVVSEGNGRFLKRHQPECFRI